MTIPSTIVKQDIVVHDSQVVVLAAAVWREVSFRPFRVYMGVVMAMACFYYFVLAVPLYVSQTQFAIKSKAAVATVPILAALTGQTSTGLTEMTAVSNFVQSQEMLDYLEKKLHLREAYSTPRLDFLNYLPAHATDHKFLNFYRSKLIIDIDTDANIVTLQTLSFDAAGAQALAAAILDKSSSFIDQMSSQMREESIRSAQIDFNQARADDVKARLAVTNFHSTAGNLSPVDAGTAMSAAEVAAEAQIVQLDASIASLKTYSTENSPQVLQIRAQIKYLQDKIAEYRKSMSGNSQSDTVNGQLDRFHDLAMQQSYADQRMAVAQAALDQSKSVADQKQLFVVPITHPSLPDEATMPQKFTGILSVLVIAAAIYGVGALLAASIRDHTGG